MTDVPWLEGEIESVDDFLKKLMRLQSFGEEILFRGQDRKGNLLPGIARADPKQNTEDVERKMLREMRRLGPKHLVGVENDDLSLMILAQHYGLKTRLLDWTSNPLAALWFACAKDPDGDSFVYACPVEEHQWSHPQIPNPFTHPRTTVLRPSFSNDRIAAQHGWFSLHHYAESAGAFVPLENMRGSGDLTLLAEFRVAKEKRVNIRSELDRCGINHRTLMPDMVGLCSYLNWKLNS